MYTLIVVDYNALEKTIDYVCAAYGRLGPEGAGHTVIIENGNPTGTLEKMSARFGQYETVRLNGVGLDVYHFHKDGQQVCYCNSCENLGYAKGNNLGVAVASAMWNDPYYIISNNDLVFCESFDLNAVTARFECDPQIGAIGPRIQTPTGLLQSPRCWQSPFRRLFVTYWMLALGSVLPQGLHKKLWNRFCDDTQKNPQNGPCHWLMGCFFFIKREAFAQAGGFDPNTFLYAEEMIFSRRLEKAGFYSYYCDDIVIIHSHGQTTKTAMSQIKMVELDFNSNCYYYQTYEHTPKAVLLLAKWNFAMYKALFLGWQKMKMLRRA